MNCNCKNGTTVIDFLTLVPGGELDNANYQISLTHYTCGNRKICASGFYPVAADLKYTVLGTPQDIGNKTFCCDVLVTGTCTYMPYKCGQQCQCNICPVTENIYFTMCVPCSSNIAPIITGGNVVATPTNLTDCCNITNAVAITTSFNVDTPAAATSEPQPSVETRKK